VALADLDATLQRLRSAAAQIGANLLELEHDPTRPLLEVTVLQGVTADRWAEAEAEWSALWNEYRALNDVLEEAQSLRGNRSWLSPDKEDRLARLLTSTSIEVARTAVPIRNRPLLGSSQSSIRCTPDELLERMAGPFDRMRTLLADTATAWDDLVPRVSAARNALDAVTAATPGLDAEVAPELARLRPRLDALGSTLIADPLSVTAADLDAVEADITALGNQIDEAVALRDECAERLTGARARLDEAGAAVDAAATQHAQAIAKIVAPAVPVPRALPSDLAVELTQIEGLTEQGQWRAAHAALEAWTARTDAVIERARADAAANQVPLAARQELRGRLDAYQAKARRGGLLEDREVAALYDAAHRALHTAPTDLDDAGARVRRYQEAVSPTRPSEGTPQ